jgi:RNA polymerase-binding protein DksA
MKSKKTKTPSSRLKKAVPIKAAKSSPISPIKNLEPFKHALKEIRRRIAGGLEQLEGESLKKSQRDATGDLSGYALHMADVATDNFDMEFSISLATNEQNALNLVDEALERIGDGTFGICQSCSKPITQKRLIAMPYARLCISCQEHEEKHPRLG